MNENARRAVEMAEEIKDYLAHLPPLKLSNIVLPSQRRPPNSQTEVVMPLPMRLNKTVKFLEMLDPPRRRPRTFGRGELKIT